MTQDRLAVHKLREVLRLRFASKRGGGPEARHRRADIRLAQDVLHLNRWVSP